MKIFKILTFILATLTCRVDVQNRSAAAPESKKIDILLPQTVVDPVLIRSSNLVKKTESQYSPVVVVSGNGEVLTARQKRVAKSKVADGVAVIRKIKKNPANHKYFKDYQIRPSYYNPNERKLEDTNSDLSAQNELNELYDDIENPENYTNETENELKVDEGVAQKSNAQMFEGEVEVRDPIDVIDLRSQVPSSVDQNQNEDLTKIFTSTEESEKESQQARQIHTEHLQVAYSHIENLEDQIRDAIGAPPDYKPASMSPKVKKLLESFIDQIDFLEGSLSGLPGLVRPGFYDYALDITTSLDDLTIFESDEESESESENRDELPGDEDYEYAPDRRQRNLKFTQRKNRQLRMTVKKNNYYRRPNRRARDVTVYPDLPLVEYNSEPSLRLKQPQDIHSGDINNYMLIVESLYSFYNATFLMLPDPANITPKDETSTRKAFEVFDQIQQFKKHFEFHISTFEKDLLAVKTQLKSISNGVHNATNFFGYDNVFQAINCQSQTNCTALESSLKMAVDVQAKFYSDRILNIIIYLDENKNDIAEMKLLFSDITLPKQNQSLFNQEFIDTINYTNEKLPRILKMKETLFRHIKDLQAGLSILKEQQKEMDKIFARAKEGVLAEKSSPTMKTAISLVVLMLASVL
jgi:hypothetical protein